MVNAFRPARMGAAFAWLQPFAVRGGLLTAMLGEESFHPDTRALLVYGRALAGNPTAKPKKGGADQVLERLFVIERAADGRLPVRSFGAELVKLFGRDLREHDLSALFLAPDLRLLNALIDASAAASEPSIARVIADMTDRSQLGAEILITPLKTDERLGIRFLGLFRALGGQAFVSGRQIQRLRLGSLHPPQAKEPKGMRLVVVNDQV